MVKYQRKKTELAVIIGEKAKNHIQKNTRRSRQPSAKRTTEIPSRTVYSRAYILAQKHH